MKPTNPTLSDYYAHHIHHQPSQYYSYFPIQNPNPNPNPYPLHHQQRQLQIEPPQYTSAVTDPYPINYAGSDYNGHPASTVYDAHYSGYDAQQANGLTYSHEVSAVPPNSYTAHLLAQNWAEAELAQQYGNSVYASGKTVTQDGSQQLPMSNPTHGNWSSPWKKIPKKIKIAQSAWCEVCKIECNTKDILYKHQMGRKHIKNIEKLNSIASVPATSSTAHVNPAIIGPMENPKKSTKKKTETPEELEMKRRKVVEGGASVNAVRTCGICNVVCNSDTVFGFHLSGQKHASMVKLSQQNGAV